MHTEYSKIKKKFESIKDIRDVENLEYVDMIVALLEYIEQSPAWISVEDRLPEDDGDFLVFDTKLGRVVGYYERKLWKADFDYDGWRETILESVTHFVSLPKEPK